MTSPLECEEELYPMGETMLDDLLYPSPDDFGDFDDLLLSSVSNFSSVVFRFA